MASMFDKEVLEEAEQTLFRILNQPDRPNEAEVAELERAARIRISNEMAETGLTEEQIAANWDQPHFFRYALIEDNDGLKVAVDCFIQHTPSNNPAEFWQQGVRVDY